MSCERCTTSGPLDLHRNIEQRALLAAYQNGVQEVRKGMFILTSKFRTHTYNLESLLQKLSKVAAPDPFTTSSDSIKSGSRKVGEIKLGKKSRYSVSRRAVSAGECAFFDAQRLLFVSVRPYAPTRASKASFDLVQKI